MGNRLQAELSAKSQTRAQTHKPRDLDLSRSPVLNQLSHTGAPGLLLSLSPGSLFKYLDLPLADESSPPFKLPEGKDNLLLF